MKYIFKIVLCVLLAPAFCTSTYAQVFASGIYNSSGQVYDFTNAETVTNDANGVGYVANGSGEFYHFGPATATITVNGLYNAFNPNNNGFIGTIATPGVDYFQGLNGAKATAQEIAGTVAPRFGILKLDNGPNQINITNTNGAEVGLRTDFTNGITTTIRSNINTGSLKFLDDATYTGAGNSSLTVPNDAQHVNGYVTKTGNDAFVFPVGSGTDARPLQISAPGSTTDSYSVAWIVGDPTTTVDPSGSPALHPISSFAGPIVAVSPVGQWDWIPVSGTGSGLTITVSIPDMTSFASASRLRLVGWNGTQWVDLSGGPTASGNAENNTLSGTMIAGITAIGIGTVQILPVTMISFTAVAKQCTAVLNWKTGVEINFSRYIVEYSTNGINFAAVGTITGQNNPLGSTYAFTHITPAPGLAYYRLKIVDIDASYEYSNIVTAKLNCSTAITFGPNPATTEFIIRGSDLEGSQVIVYDAIGQELTAIKTATAVQAVNIATFPKGTYFVKVIKDGNVIATAKILKP